jgi:DNA-binding IclR family transcriptional regulator
VLWLDGHYLPGPTILSLAGRALQQIDISAIAQPIVDELVAQVQCTVHVGVATATRSST